MSKKHLRQDMLVELRKLDEGSYWEKSKRIHRNLLAERQFGPSDLIGITVSRMPEVDTTRLIEQLWQAGARVAVPKCDPKTRSMEFYIITSFEELETVYIDLKEPIPEKTVKVSPSELSLLIVPGVVFSQAGYRIGFGGGYYDRFLLIYNGPTVSLAFDCQVAEEIPYEAHDIPVRSIITENRNIDCEKADGHADRL